MAFEGVTKCAVPSCKKPCSQVANLCEKHQVSGAVYQGKNGTCVVTCWYTEHDGKRGIIMMNDFALGDLFGGAEGFRVELKQQGFTAIRNLTTPEEFASAKAEIAKAAGRWSGPWMTEYPWQKENQSPQ